VRVRYIVFKAVNEVACASVDQEMLVTESGALVEMRYTCISAGTELAKLSGLQPLPFPVGPLGNRAIGRVLQVGDGRDDLQSGDLVFCHGHHVSHAVISADRETAGLLVKLPDELDRPEATTIGMASVALTGLRVAQPELGDIAVVTGAGLVGQFAAQLLQLSGVETVLVDPVPGRLEIARQCGVKHPVGIDEAEDRVMELSEGKGAEHVLECTGVPAVLKDSVRFAARAGQVVMVGSPRGEFHTDLTSFLNAFHLWRPHGDLTLSGAHEWKIPLYPEHSSKHSIARNIKILADLVVARQLVLDPLLTAVFHPEDGQRAYAQLREGKDAHLGTVFDWT